MSQTLTAEQPRVRKTHYFDSSGDAYDESQCNDEIAEGDLLVVKSERIVAIATTWPFALTRAFGMLHTPAVGVDIETDASFAEWKDAILAAKALMRELDFE